ncbi:MAG: SBBP repeat-containing protein, partial [Candidatus Delongbacteria bacterium]|nr:SBBP repeat-containing protein [Candidatus Delongbacteria bacterium]
MKNCKRIILILLFISISLLLFAQAPDWQWVTQAGGNLSYAIAIDDNEYSYVTGFFFGNAIFGSYSLTSSGSGDIFVAKMDANGNWLWATKAGGNYYDTGNGIAIDDNGNSYIIGHFVYTATFSSYSLTSSGSADIFVAKMDAYGNWQWAGKAGGTNGDEGYAITIDEVGNSYVTGSFRETAVFGSYSLTSSGEWDIFVAKMD